MEFDVTLAGAFVAGILSFASPCVLPLVPPYLGFLGGVTFDELTAARSERDITRRVFISALAFIFGFATVFVALGAAASAISGLIAANAGWLSKIAGVIIVVFGLHFLGLFRLRLLDREWRFHAERRPPGLIGAYALGLAFAFGWTPCIGPILAAILTVAATQEEAIRGAVLLGAYALGIGMPFLAAALFVRPFLGVLRGLRPRMERIEQAMGALLVITGVLVFAGTFEEIGYWLLRAVPALGRLG